MDLCKLGFGISVVALVLGGCGSKGEGGGSASKEVDVAAFQGGYGIDFYEQAAKEFDAKNPGLPVKVWGNPRVWEQLKPRFIAGNPPDLSLPGWDMGYWALVYDGQLDSWDEALDGPAPDGKGTWRDTFIPETLKLGQHEGKTYLLPYYYIMQGWWYNPDLFAKHGWAPPKTWSELLALCEKIKAAGIAPITFQGQYPGYMINGFLLPWAISAGGIKAVDDAQNLVPGAWKSPAMLKAAQMIDELRVKGYFQRNATGMSHTDSQIEFVLDRAAMIPCGTWLHSEMAKQLPKGFNMRFFSPPVLDAGVGDPTNICIAVEPWIIPSKAKNKKRAIEFFKYMTSLEKAKQFVVEKGSLTAIKGSDQVKLPVELAGAAEAAAKAKTVWSVEYGQWYPDFSKETEGAMSALISGDITPQEFCDRCEAAAEEARNNPDLVKHKVNR
jgi:N-acetylglucosamine transport system substrate-binding protein